jgi:exopolyphosphatase/guanosine-5'-triphosphate,3'-diphosphate pyrophosphatase
VSRGAVDIGTNTVRLLIRDGDVELERRIVIVGLGVGVDATGVLAPEAMERAAVVLAEYGALLDRHGAVQRRAVATSACRDAANSEEFLDRVATLIGVRPEVIMGEEEAVLSFRGATRAVPGGGSTLVIDPGGGSTEFVYGTDAVEYARSIDIGSVRLNDRMPAGRPASAAVVAAARAAVREELAAVRLPGIPQRIIGVAGTYTSLAAIHLGLQQYDRERVHGARMSVAALDGMVERFAGLTLEQTADIPAMDPKRAPLMLSGAIIAAESVRLAGQEVIVSEFDLLDALIAIGGGFKGWPRRVG